MPYKSQIMVIEIIIDLIYEFKRKVQRNESENQSDWRYHYFVATRIDENCLQGHMLTSTKVQYEHNENLERKHFKQFFPDGQECKVKFKNSQFLAIPLIKLTAEELIDASLHVKPVGQLTIEALELIDSKKLIEKAMTWQDYLLNYQPFEKGPA